MPPHLGGWIYLYDKMLYVSESGLRPRASRAHRITTAWSVGLRRNGTSLLPLRASPGAPRPLRHLQRPAAWGWDRM